MATFATCVSAFHIKLPGKAKTLDLSFLRPPHKKCEFMNILGYAKQKQRADHDKQFFLMFTEDFWSRGRWTIVNKTSVNFITDTMDAHGVCLLKGTTQLLESHMAWNAGQNACCSDNTNSKWPLARIAWLHLPDLGGPWRNRRQELYMDDMEGMYVYSSYLPESLRAHWRQVRSSSSLSGDVCSWHGILTPIACRI